MVELIAQILGCTTLVFTVLVILADILIPDNPSSKTESTRLIYEQATMDDAMLEAARAMIHEAQKNTCEKSQKYPN